MVYIFSSFMVISSFLQTLHRMQNRITSNLLYFTLFCKKIYKQPLTLHGWRLCHYLLCTYLLLLSTFEDINWCALFVNVFHVDIVHNFIFHLFWTWNEPFYAWQSLCFSILMQHQKISSPALEASSENLPASPRRKTWKEMYDARWCIWKIEFLVVVNSFGFQRYLDIL